MQLSFAHRRASHLGGFKIYCDPRPPSQQDGRAESSVTGIRDASAVIKQIESVGGLGGETPAIRPEGWLSPVVKLLNRSD